MAHDTEKGRKVMIDDLHGRGWEAFTLPYGEKAPPPSGWTGSTKNITEEMIYEEIEKEGREPRNIGIALPKGIVGIDIDDTSTPQARQIRDETRYGWRVSSTNGVRRYTAFYALPDGTEEEELRNIPGIDLITHYHRYSVISGKHPSGRKYTAFSPSSEIDAEDLPDPDELPYLPPRVIDLMRRPGRHEAEERRRTPHKRAEPIEAPDTYQHRGTPCRTAYRAYQRGMESLQGESNHATLLKIATMLSELTKKGHMVGSLPADLIEAFVSRAGAHRAKEAHRAIRIIKPAQGMCECRESGKNRAFYIDSKMMEKVGMEREEVEAEVFERVFRSGKSFQAQQALRRYEEITAHNLLEDLRKKEDNRRKAETRWSTHRKKTTHRNENQALTRLIETIAETQRERQICYLIGHLYTDQEIADILGISRKTVGNAKREMRKRVGK